VLLRDRVVVTKAYITTLAVDAIANAANPSAFFAPAKALEKPVLKCHPSSVNDGAVVFEADTAFDKVLYRLR